MEILIVIVLLVISLIVLAIISEFSIKKIKEIAKNEKLDKIISKLPPNTQVCKNILKKLKNEKVTIEENVDSDTSLYIAISNKIIISNTRNNYTRIQTIAHECLHSIQNRRLLIFNFIYSNIYLIIFAILIILGILKILPSKLLFLTIFIILGFIYYFIRSYLEDDAMTKARFLAKEYFEEEKTLTKEEIIEVVDKYDDLNDIAIKSTNFNLFMNVIIKTIILGIIFIIF